MVGDELEPGLGGDEMLQPSHPGRTGRGRTGQRHVRQRPAPLGELLGVGGEAVAPPPGAVGVPAAVGVPGEDAVEVRLVADLQGVDVPATDAGEKRPPLGGGDAGPAGGQVDPQDQPGVEVGGQGLRGAQPALGDGVVDAARRDHPPLWPPAPVGAVAADPHHRRLAGRQAGDKLEQNRVDRERIATGVLVQRPVLERHADEARRHRLAAGGRGDGRGERVSERARGRAEHESERRHQGEACAAAKHAGMVAHREGVHVCAPAAPGRAGTRSSSAEIVKL